MRLYAYNIGGQPIGTVVESWSLDDLGSKDAFVFATSAPIGYTDITTIDTIHTIGFNSKHDFKFVRDRIKELVVKLGQDNIIGTYTDPSLIVGLTAGQAFTIGTPATGDWVGKESKIAIWSGTAWSYCLGDAYAPVMEEYGFSLLSTEHKKICAGYLIGTFAQEISAFPTQDEKTAVQSKYKVDVQNCRALRYKYCENYFLQMIPGNSASVMGVILPNGLHFLYRDQGIDGLAYGDPLPGLADYVNGTGPFAGNGIRNKAWTTIYGQTMSVFCDYICDKLFVTGLTKDEIKSVL